MGDKAQKPAIRFEGFTDAWEQRKFGDMYEKISEKNDMSFGTESIISVANMYFKPDAKVSDDDYLKTYNVMRLGDIAFEGNKSKNFAHGRFVENTIGNGIVSHVFDVFPSSTAWRRQGEWVQATVWELRKEMVRGVRFFKTALRKSDG